MTYLVCSYCYEPVELTRLNIIPEHVQPGLEDCNLNKVFVCQHCFERYKEDEIMQLRYRERLEMHLKAVLSQKYLSVEDICLLLGISEDAVKKLTKDLDPIIGYKFHNKDIIRVCMGRKKAQKSKEKLS